MNALFKQKNLDHSKRGFTLIEILVVISIIGILSSVVFASLSSARGKARDVRRVAEMRSIATALEAYHLRNGTYPSVPDANSGTATDNNWADVNVCRNEYYDISHASIGLTPEYLPAMSNDPLHDGSNGWEFCHWYAGPDFLGRDGYILYFEFEGEVDLPRDCGDGDWGGNWYCIGE